MRILQVNKFHWLKGGSERYYFDLQSELAARGHAVAVFASAHPASEPTPWAPWFAPHADYHHSTPLTALRLAADVIDNRAAAVRLRALLAEFRPDVAHLHNIHHQLSPSILIEFERAGVPVVQTLHDYKWVCPAYLFLSRGEVCERCGPGNRFAPVVTRGCHHDSRLKSWVVYAESSRAWSRGDVNRVARFLAPSRFLQEKVVAHGLPAGRTLHEPYFIRPGEWRPADRPGDYFLYMGRLSREKGLATLFEAAARGIGRPLHVAGDGPLAAELRTLASGRNLPIIFRGHLSGEDLRDAVRGARAVVVPSEWYENLPYAVLESMALGVAVVATSIGGIPEMVEDGVTGRLVSPGEPEMLAAALRSLAADAGAAGDMGRAGRRRIEAEFAAGPALERLIALYGDLAGGAGR